MEAMLWTGLITGAIAIIIGFIMGQATLETWLVNSQSKKIDALKAQILDTEKLKIDNEVMAETIKAIVCQYGKVEDDKKWDGYDYEQVKLNVEGLNTLPPSSYEKFEARGICVVLPRNNVLLASPMIVEIRANRKKKAQWAA